jgi:hypothetical protein
MLPELIREKEKIKEKDRRNRNWFALFYLLLPVFEMMLLIAGECFLIRCWTVGIS